MLPGNKAVQFVEILLLFLEIIFTIKLETRAHMVSSIFTYSSKLSNFSQLFIICLTKLNALKKLITMCIQRPIPNFSIYVAFLLTNNAIILIINIHESNH